MACTCTYIFPGRIYKSIFDRCNCSRHVQCMCMCVVCVFYGMFVCMCIQFIFTDHLKYWCNNNSTINKHVQNKILCS